MVPIRTASCRFPCKMHPAMMIRTICWPLSTRKNHKRMHQNLRILVMAMEHPIPQWVITVMETVPLILQSVITVMAMGHLILQWATTVMATDHPIPIICWPLSTKMRTLGTETGRRIRHLCSTTHQVLTSWGMGMLHQTRHKSHQSLPRMGQSVRTSKRKRAVGFRSHLGEIRNGSLSRRMEMVPTKNLDATIDVDQFLRYFPKRRLPATKRTRLL
mmetsp:Transcript_733/g.1447  ORF Transcript_733/g.1447 Transcript_733/m.1447 type:complete len:216 (+) Transcript_733:416-1063(+)